MSYMTVADLVRHLQDFDQDLPIGRRDSSSGFAPIELVSVKVDLTDTFVWRYADHPVVYKPEIEARMTEGVVIT